MNFRVGDYIETTISTPWTEYDPYSNEGVNHFNDKYPKGTKGYICFVGKSGNVGVALSQDPSDTCFVPFYPPSGIRLA